MRRTTCLTVALLFAIGSTAHAEDAVKHRIMFAEYGKGPNRLVELDADGKVVWEYKFPSIAVIFQVLPDGHVLFAHGGAPPASMRSTATKRPFGATSANVRKSWGVSGSTTATR